MLEFLLILGQCSYCSFPKNISPSQKTQKQVQSETWSFRIIRIFIDSSPQNWEKQFSVSCQCSKVWILIGRRGNSSVSRTHYEPPADFIIMALLKCYSSNLVLLRHCGQKESWLKLFNLKLRWQFVEKVSWMYLTNATGKYQRCILSGKEMSLGYPVHEPRCWHHPPNGPLLPLLYPSFGPERRTKLAVSQDNHFNNKDVESWNGN